MTKFGLGALVALLKKIAADLKSTEPLPSSSAVPMTSAEMLLAVDTIAAMLPQIRAEINAYPGEFRAADDVLEALTAAGVTWSPALQKLVDGFPGVLGTVIKVIPEVAFVLRETQPAETGIPGGWGGARGHI